MIMRRFQLDVALPGSQLAIYARKGDTRVYAAIVSLCEKSVPLRINSHWSVALRAKKPDGKLLYDRAKIENGQICVYFDTQAFSAVGVIRCELNVYGINGEALFTPSFDVYVEDVVVPDGSIESTSEFTALTDAMNKVNGYAENIASVIINADAAIAAAKKATSAANSATEATDKAANNAQEAAKAISGMTVSAKDVTSTEPSTATISDVSGHKHILFGLKQGVKGEDGASTALAPGLFGFYVSEAGRLMLVHNDNEPVPPLGIDDRGHLVYRIS